MNRLLFAFVMLAALAGGMVPAQAGCYSVEEQEAEQVVRLHSELMVISLTCRSGSAGQPLIKAYQDFTRQNLSLIRDAEKTLMSWQNRQGGGAQRWLDRMRTEMGNEYSQILADQSPQVFCDLRRDRAWQAATWSPSDVRGEVGRLAISYNGRAPLCTKTAANAVTPP